MRVTIDQSDFYINDAMVTGADFSSDNGVVHIINAVLVPGEATNINTDQTVEVSIFPNPAMDFIQIQLGSAFNNEAELRVFDINGQQVKVINLLSTQTSIDVTELNKGVYFFTIGGNGNSIIKKVIIN